MQNGAQRLLGRAYVLFVEGLKWRILPLRLTRRLHRWRQQLLITLAVAAGRQWQLRRGVVCPGVRAAFFRREQVSLALALSSEYPCLHLVLLNLLGLMSGASRQNDRAMVEK